MMRNPHVHQKMLLSFLLISAIVIMTIPTYTNAFPSKSLTKRFFIWKCYDLCWSNCVVLQEKLGGECDGDGNCVCSTVNVPYLNVDLKP